MTDTLDEKMARLREQLQAQGGDAPRPSDAEITEMLANFFVKSVDRLIEDLQDARVLAEELRRRIADKP